MPRGRPKGSPNKVPRHLKEMILEALDKAGGVEYLASQAGESPGAFLSLIGKILPMQIAGDPDGAPVKLQMIERVIVRPKP